MARFEAMPVTRNHLLAALPDEERELVIRRSRPIAVLPRDILQRAGGVRSLILPETLVVSVLQPLVSGEMVDAASVGCEGIAPAPAALGAAETGAITVVLIGGDGWELDRSDYLDLFRALPAFRQQTLDFVARFLDNALLDIACNRLHSVEQRLARTLLATADRTVDDRLPLTHEALSLMLGVYRPTITHAMSHLRHSGLVASGRGHILLLDRPRLEGVACNCYSVARQRVFGALQSEVQPGREPEA